MDLVYFQEKEVASSRRSGRCLSCVHRSTGITKMEIQFSRCGLLGGGGFHTHQSRQGFWRSPLRVAESKEKTSRAGAMKSLPRDLEPASTFVLSLICVSFLAGHRQSLGG